jgi:GNAT superfamily N-acetyltransferase
MWFAEVEETHEAVGSVSLATRAGATGSNAAIHWLMVAPEWRRHGVGSLLLAELEQQCWQDGMRKVLLETHDGWHAALSFYEEHGYVRKS